MANSLSNLTNYLCDQLYNNCSDCKNLLDYMAIKNDKIAFRCFEGKKNFTKDFNNELLLRFKTNSDYRHDKECLKHLTIRIWEIIKIFMFNVMFCNSVIYLEILEINV